MKRSRWVVGLLLCVVGALWLVPTVFVKKTSGEIVAYTRVGGDGRTDRYRVEYRFERDGKTQFASFMQTLDQGVLPQTGAQLVCRYYLFWPEGARVGDPKSPVPPLCLILLGLAVLFFRKPGGLKPKNEN